MLPRSRHRPVCVPPLLSLVMVIGTEGQGTCQIAAQRLPKRKAPQIRAGLSERDRKNRGSEVRRAPRNHPKFSSPILHMQRSQCLEPVEQGNAMAVKAVHASTSAPELPFGGRSTTVGGLMPLGRARCGDPARPRTLGKMSRLLVPSLAKFPALANFCGRALFADFCGRALFNVLAQHERPKPSARSRGTNACAGSHNEGPRDGHPDDRSCGRYDKLADRAPLSKLTGGSHRQTSSRARRAAQNKDALARGVVAATSNVPRCSPRGLIRTLHRVLKIKAPQIPAGLRRGTLGDWGAEAESPSCSNNALRNPFVPCCLISF
jgi:hypothetical protein